MGVFDWHHPSFWEMSSVGCHPVNHFNRGNTAVCVCADGGWQTWRGGVGIVCHQMNSWGETNEECREKEGGILIGSSLSHSSPFFLQGEQEIECWLYRGKKGFQTLALQTPCPTNWSITHPVTYFDVVLHTSCLWSTMGMGGFTLTSSSFTSVLWHLVLIFAYCSATIFRMKHS